jgi:hypothetical protein
MAAGLAVIGCATEQTSTELPPVTVEDTTTTSTTTTTTTTTTTSTTTTTVAPTTSPPTTAPIDPTSEYFVGGGGDGPWLYLGSHDPGGWTRSQAADGSALAPTLDEGTGIRVSRLGAGATASVVGPAGEACHDGRIGRAIDAEVPAPDPPGFGYSAIALQGRWPLRPRPVVEIDAVIPSYGAAGEAIFAADGVDATAGEVVETWLADLDGDRDEEAVVVFEHTTLTGLGDTATVAAIFVVDTATGAVRELMSNALDPADEFPVSERYRVLDIADIDGDGVMEVAVHSWYYEGAGVIVFQYDGTSFTEVLSTGCGS